MLRHAVQLCLVPAVQQPAEPHQSQALVCNCSARSAGGHRARPTQLHTDVYDVAPQSGPCMYDFALEALEALRTTPPCKTIHVGVHFIGQCHRNHCVVMQALFDGLQHLKETRFHTKACAFCPMSLSRVHNIARQSRAGYSLSPFQLT